MSSKFATNKQHQITRSPEIHKSPCFRTPTCWAVLTIKLPDSWVDEKKNSSGNPAVEMWNPSIPSIKSQPGTPNNQFKMDGSGETTNHFLCKGWKSSQWKQPFFYGWPWGSRNRFFRPQVVFPAFLFTKQYGSFPPPLPWSIINRNWVFLTQKIRMLTNVSCKKSFNKKLDEISPTTFPTG